MTNTASATTFLATRQVGQKYYELKDHLGNIRAVVTDKRTAAGDVEVASASNYYPFGMLQPGNSAFSKDYRFGFNGKEMDNDLGHGAGNMYDYGFRIYNPRIAKFLSVDPLTKGYPMLTPYQFASNRPIDGIDLDGLETVNYQVMLYDNYETYLSSNVKDYRQFDLQNPNQRNELIYLLPNDISIDRFNNTSSVYTLVIFRPLILTEREKHLVEEIEVVNIIGQKPNNFSLAQLGWDLDNSIRGNTYGEWEGINGPLDGAGAASDVSIKVGATKEQIKLEYRETAEGTETISLSEATYLIPGNSKPEMVASAYLFFDFKGPNNINSNSITQIKGKKEYNLLMFGWDATTNTLKIGPQFKAGGKKTNATKIEVETKLRENKIQENVNLSK